MKNDFEELISRMDMGEERISELKDISIESLNTEKQREQRLRKIDHTIQGLWENYKRCNIYVMGIPEGEERGTEEIFETIMD